MKEHQIKDWNKLFELIKYEIKELESNDKNKEASFLKFLISSIEIYKIHNQDKLNQSYINKQYNNLINYLSYDSQQKLNIFDIKKYYEFKGYDKLKPSLAYYYNLGKFYVLEKSFLKEPMVFMGYNNWKNEIYCWDEDITSVELLLLSTRK